MSFRDEGPVLLLSWRPPIVSIGVAMKTLDDVSGEIKRLRRLKKMSRIPGGEEPNLTGHTYLRREEFIQYVVGHISPSRPCSRNGGDPHAPPCREGAGRRPFSKLPGNRRDEANGKTLREGLLICDRHGSPTKTLSTSTSETGSPNLA